CKSDDLWYQGYLEADGKTGTIQIFKDKAYRTLHPERRPPLNAPLQAGQPWELELRVENDLLTLKANGQVVFEAKDATPPNGRWGVAMDGSSEMKLQSLEFLGLGSQPAAVNATLTEKPAAGASAGPSAATKEAPFVNSLGMKFVPVPITGGPT